MFFLTVPHWAVYTLVLLLHVCSLKLIDIDINVQAFISGLVPQHRGKDAFFRVQKYCAIANFPRLNTCAIHEI